MVQKKSSEFSDQDVIRIFTVDVVLSQKIRNTDITLWEQLERRALRLGAIIQLYQGERTPRRGVTWQDREFLGF